MYPESITQESGDIYEAPPTSDIDVLQIIEKNKSAMHAECTGDCIYHKKWMLKVRRDIISIVDHSVTSFSNKLIKINCGSTYEKELFLSAVSGNITNQPFGNIESIIIRFVRKIQEDVARYADKKIESMTNNRSFERTDNLIVSIVYLARKIKSEVANYAYKKIESITNSAGGNLKKIILESAEKALREDYNILELTRSIYNEISEFHKGKYIEKGLEKYIEVYVKKELNQYLDIEKIPFTAFVDLYRDHMEETHHYLISKSIEIFSNVLQDKECCMSFVFDTFLGEMIYYKHADKLRSIFYKNIMPTRRMGELSFLGLSGNDSYSDKMKGFYLSSEKKVKKEIEKYLLENDIIVVDKDLVTTCSKEFVKKVVDSSVTHSRTELELRMQYSSRGRKKIKQCNIVTT